MFPYLSLMTARMLQDERLREAELYRRSASVRTPHQWRRRVGNGLIHLGRVLAEEPVERPATTRARIA
jgi:hypothetical protein